jgi:paraquat-inducible protein A
LALAIAALIVFLIANAYPLASLSVQGATQRAGWPEALLITWNQGHWLVSSMTALLGFVLPVLQLLVLLWVLVPLTKLLSLLLLLFLLQKGSAFGLVARTRLYRSVEFIGQWSMLDVFVVILLAALAKFHGLLEISAGSGAAAFGLVVILTMLAAMSFDPHQSWDIARVPKRAQ